MNLNGANSGFTNTLSGNNFGSSFGDSSFATSFTGAAKPPESKVERLNALESWFGTLTTQPAPVQVQAPTPAFETSFPAQKPKGNDFGEFPTTFGSTPGGFGSFQGFGNDGFGSSAATDLGLNRK